MSPPPTNIDGTDITGATIDGQEVEEITIDGNVVFTSGITTVTSRPDDNNTASVTDSRGLVIRPKDDFPSVGARISNNTSGVVRARLYDYTAASYIETVDISGLTAGDAFAFVSPIDSGDDYGIEVDNNGSSYTVGFRGNEKDYPYTGQELDIVAVSDDGIQDPVAVQGVNDIGNPGGIL